MNDGKVNKFAVIINGYSEERFLDNVEDSLDVFKNEGYATYVASKKKPSTKVDSYVVSTADNIKSLINNLNKKIDDDDELVIYTTGHGLDTGMCIENDNCYSDLITDYLDKIKYGQRTVIMSQCYSGNWKSVFLDDPKTLFISASDKDEVSYSLFSRYFWAEDVVNLNNDSKISWQERYSWALTKGEYEYFAIPQFAASAGYTQAGNAPFKAAVTDVNTEKELKQKLDALKAGQYALLLFSPAWCGACTKYNPQFQMYAKEADGQYLFLKTASEELFKRYIIGEYPTVLVINNAGESNAIENLYKLPEEIALFNTNLKDVLYILENSSVKSPSLIIKSARLVKKYNKKDASEQLQIVMDYLEGLLKSKDLSENIKEYAIEIYGEMAETVLQKDADAYAIILRDLFNDGSINIKYSAALAYDGFVKSNKLSKDELINGAKAMLKLPWNYDSYFSEAMVNTYSSIISLGICKTLNSDDANKISKGLITLLDSKNVDIQKNAMNAYDEMADMLSYSETLEILPDILKFFTNNDAGIKIAAIILCTKIAVKLSNAEKNKIAKALLELLKDKDCEVRIVALKKCGEFIDILNDDLRSKYVDALGKLFKDPDILVKSLAIKLLADMLDTIELKKVIKFLSELLDALKDNNFIYDVRKAVLEAYATVVTKLPYNDRLEWIKYLETLFLDIEIKFAQQVMSTYSNLASNLEIKDAANCAIALTGCFQSENPKLQTTAVNSYSVIAKKLTAKEIIYGAKLVRLMFEDDNAEAIIAAISVYCELADVIPDIEIIKGAEALLDLFESPSPEIRKKAILTYAELLFSKIQKYYWWTGTYPYTEKHSLITDSHVAKALYAMKVLFKDSDQAIKNAIELAYSILGKDLDWKEMKDEHANLQELIKYGDMNERATAIVAYGTLLSLKYPHYHDEAKQFLEMLNPNVYDSEVRKAALYVYGKLIIGIELYIGTTDELLEDAIIIKNAFNDLNDEVREMAFYAYSKLVQTGLLTSDEVIDGAMSIAPFLINDNLELKNAAISTLCSKTFADFKFISDGEKYPDNFAISLVQYMKVYDDFSIYLHKNPKKGPFSIDTFSGSMKFFLCGDIYKNKDAGAGEGKVFIKKSLKSTGQ